MSSLRAQDQNFEKARGKDRAGVLVPASCSIVKHAQDTMSEDTYQHDQPLPNDPVLTEGDNMRLCFLDS